MIVPWHKADREKGDCPVVSSGPLKYWLAGSPTVDRIALPHKLVWNDKLLPDVHVIAFEVLPPEGWTAGPPGVSDTCNPSVKSIVVMDKYGAREVYDLDKINGCEFLASMIAWSVAEWHRKTLPPPDMSHRQHLTVALRLAIARLEEEGLTVSDLEMALAEHGSKKV